MGLLPRRGLETSIERRYSFRARLLLAGTRKCNKIETPAANIFNKTVFKKEKLTQERREVLAYFFALLQLRTPAFFSSLEQPLSQLMYMLTSTYHQFYSENPAAFEETKKEMAADGKPLPDWFKPEHIDPKPFKISPTKDLIFGTGLQSAETSAGLLNGMTWNFLTTTEEKPFITSDNPLCHLTFENGQAGEHGACTSERPGICPTVINDGAFGRVGERVRISLP